MHASVPGAWAYLDCTQIHHVRRLCLCMHELLMCTIWPPPGICGFHASTFNLLFLMHFCSQMHHWILACVYVCVDLCVCPSGPPPPLLLERYLKMCCDRCTFDPRHPCGVQPCSPRPCALKHKGRPDSVYKAWQLLGAQPS